MPSERTSRRSGTSFSSPVGACSSARRCGQSVGVQRDGMIDYALVRRTWEFRLLHRHTFLMVISESGGTTKRLFPDLVEQRRREKFCGAAIKGEAEGRKRKQVSQIVCDL